MLGNGAFRLLLKLALKDVSRVYVYKQIILDIVGPSAVSTLRVFFECNTFLITKMFIGNYYFSLQKYRLKPSLKPSACNYRIGLIEKVFWCKLRCEPTPFFLQHLGHQVFASIDKLNIICTRGLSPKFRPSLCTSLTPLRFKPKSPTYNHPSSDICMFCLSAQTIKCFLVHVFGFK